MERRVIWAIILMMGIAIAPTFFLEPPKKPAPASARPSARGERDSGSVAPSDSAAAAPSSELAAASPAQGLEASRSPVDSVVVSSPLYRYVLSTRGAALVQASLLNYRTLGPDGRGDPVRLVQDGDRLHQLALTAGRDTVQLADWDFQASASVVDVKGPESVTFTASRGGVSVEVSYRFEPGDYQIGVQGRVSGMGPAGGHLLIDMGDGMRQTEADSAGNWYEYGIVAKTTESDLTKFSEFDAGETMTLAGPFEWAAVKSKYFVAALLAI
ncbi:MAG: membrane protein insertase YidC, partial [Gemmatimonadota bacterium]|nr:membrane protein insertase YidC [Gemmatimonadota bacterium]